MTLLLDTELRRHWALEFRVGSPLEEYELSLCRNQVRQWGTPPVHAVGMVTWKMCVSIAILCSHLPRWWDYPATLCRRQNLHIGDSAWPVGCCWGTPCCSRLCQRDSPDWVYHCENSDWFFFNAGFLDIFECFFHSLLETSLLRISLCFVFTCQLPLTPKISE